MPHYHFQQLTCICDIWTEWSTGLNGCLPVQHLNKGWGAKWQLGNCAQGTEICHHLCVVQLIEKLMAKPGRILSWPRDSCKRGMRAQLLLVSFVITSRKIMVLALRRCCRQHHTILIDDTSHLFTYLYVLFSSLDFRDHKYSTCKVHLLFTYLCSLDCTDAMLIHPALHWPYSLLFCNFYAYTR